MSRPNTPPTRTPSSFYLWHEALPEIVDELDWSAISLKSWEAIGEALDEHVSNCNDFAAPTPSASEVRAINESPEITRLKDALAAAERENEIYRQSVMRRRGARWAGIEDGKVIYDLR